MILTLGTGTAKCVCGGGGGGGGKGGKKILKGWGVKIVRGDAKI